MMVHRPPLHPATTSQSEDDPDSTLQDETERSKQLGEGGRKFSENDSDNESPESTGHPLGVDVTALPGSEGPGAGHPRTPEEEKKQEIATTDPAAAATAGGSTAALQTGTTSDHLVRSKMVKKPGKLKKLGKGMTSVVKVLLRRQTTKELPAPVIASLSASGQLPEDTEPQQTPQQESKRTTSEASVPIARRWLTPIELKSGERKM